MKWWYLSTLTSFGNDKQHNNAWLQKDISFSKRKIDIRLIPQSHRFDRTERLELDSAWHSNRSHSGCSPPSRNMPSTNNLRLAIVPDRFLIKGRGRILFERSKLDSFWKPTPNRQKADNPDNRPLPTPFRLAQTLSVYGRFRVGLAMHVTEVSFMAVITGDIPDWLARQRRKIYHIDSTFYKFTLLDRPNDL